MNYIQLPLELVEVGDFFIRLMLNLMGGISGFLGIASPNLVRGIVPHNLFPITDPIASLMGQSILSSGRSLGMSAGSIPEINF